ncbi:MULTISPECIES: hypothetical protein [unclassified Oceanobacter]|uniref:hypothetical protein n=1 Tax=unclassified Oceanobacter TaxID=2620260 RepID=UPI0027347982|nr:MULTISPECIES: hypothetical protein [unclassified Oceanobacter]MDP2609086.1 hypothetical protein [Oceanobacter sp. 1_MG-2023]MDP2612408.1 hypothetical protein [Oceanobacter sp. 2_MG-2023]
MKLQQAHIWFARLAMALIVTFWGSTIVVELIGDPDLIYQVKNAIFYAIWLLVLAMAVTGISGAKLAGTRSSGLIGRKKKRMRFVALNGVFILIPAAIYLRSLAAAGDFGSTFYTVQALELLAGAVNLTLMGFNIRDGLRLSTATKKPMAAEGSG